MSARPRIASLLALALLLGASPPIEVALIAPDGGAPAYGETEIEAEVYPPDAEVDRLEFFLDGLRVGALEAPPWKLVIDAGQDNSVHLFEVVAHHASGASATARVRTLALRTDFEIDVGLRQLYLTADRDGRPALDLTAEDFRVLDDGAEQSIVTFERGDVPFTSVVLVDSSLSMEGSKLPTAVAGARNFVERMKPLDEAKLILFADRTQLETPFTNFGSVITVGLQGIEARGGTALNDALYLAFKRLESRQGRKVVILLSDGVDVESVLEMEWVLRLSRVSQAVLYWIRLPRGGDGDPTVRRYSSWRSADEHARELELLREAVVESGGRVPAIQNVGEIDAAFQSLLEELRQQYVLGYYPSREAGPGTWHEIEVEVGDRSVRLRTRRGYLEG